MRVLFIGGTGIISSACSRFAVAEGHEVTLLNRGKSVRVPPDGAEVLRADLHRLNDVKRSLEGRRFDVVAQFIAFTPADIERDIEVFSGITDHYIFISSASAYQTPPAYLPITESTLLRNPFWAYSRAKIACEERLIRAHREQEFPATIIRPSHTYDQTLLPSHGGWTVCWGTRPTAWSSTTASSSDSCRALPRRSRSRVGCERSSNGTTKTRPGRLWIRPSMS